MSALSHVRKSPVFASLSSTAAAAVTDAWFEGMNFDIEVTVPEGAFIVRMHLDAADAGFTTIDPDGDIVAEGTAFWSTAVDDICRDSPSLSYQGRNSY